MDGLIPKKAEGKSNRFLSAFLSECNEDNRYSTVIAVLSLMSVAEAATSML